MALTKANFVGITGIVIGVLGVVGPIAWDYYKTKSEIEIRVAESSVIVEKPKKLEGLVISYGGEELDELSKTTFVVSNTGRTPVLSKDIVQPISIAFSADSKVIDAKIEATTPRDLGARIQFNRSSGSIVFDIPLLNPGDNVEVSALAKSVKADFQATARIAGVSSLSVVKDVVREKSAKTTPWTVYPVGIFSCLLGLASFIGLAHVPAELRAKRALRDGTFELPVMQSKADCLQWIDKKFFFTTTAERAAFKSRLAHLPDDSSFSNIFRAEILDGATSLVADATPNMKMVLIVSAIAALGGWYVISNI